MNKESSTTDADSKRTERLARLKELHFRRVCMSEEFPRKLFLQILE